MYVGPATLDNFTEETNDEGGVTGEPRAVVRSPLKLTVPIVAVTLGCVINGLGITGILAGGEGKTVNGVTIGLGAGFDTTGFVGPVILVTEIVLPITVTVVGTIIGAAWSGVGNLIILLYVNKKTGTKK